MQTVDMEETITEYFKENSAEMQAVCILLDLTHPENPVRAAT